MHAEQIAFDAEPLIQSANIVKHQIPVEVKDPISFLLEKKQLNNRYESIKWQIKWLSLKRKINSYSILNT